MSQWMPAREKQILALVLFEGGPAAVQGLDLIMASITAPYLRDSYLKGLAGLMFCSPQYTHHNADNRERL